MSSFSEKPLVRLWQRPHIPMSYFMYWFRERVEPCKEHFFGDDNRYEKTIKVNLRYSEKMYLTKFITDDEINAWHCDTPVFISAQTGTGKNYFVQHQLLRHLYEENKQNGTDYEILILSNRIALGRQSKQDFAESIARITGNKSYLEKFDSYTPKGIDQEYSDFGMVQILSYQAFAGSKDVLSQHNFKYIICDECHFFTSDGLFNSDTDIIMRKVVSGGGNAVRIYMSATPDVVFAPIVFSECRYLENELERNRQKELSFWDGQQHIDLIGVGHFDNEELKNEYQAIKEFKERINQIVPKLNIDFYYMERNYDYIDNIYHYEDDDDLLNEVVNADEENKWLIFVSSKRKGRALIDEIEEKIGELKKKSDKISTIFLTAESKNLSDEPTKAEKREKASYEKLVNEQTFDEDVLITTSVLDNGVNIRAETIKNVVIDYCDRTEFIQMLGRLRVTPSTKINLYIPTYSEEKIQKRLHRNIKSLVDRLIFDIVDVNFKQNKFNKQLHRYTNDGNFATYNSNAIWQLVDTINFQMSLMRVSDPNFNLETLIEDLDLKNSMDFFTDCRKVYNYYMQNDYECIWSRNIVDILTTAADIKQRADWTKEDENLNEYGNRYAFRFDDNFAKYLFEKIIPKSFDDVIKEKIQSTLSRLKNYELNNYNWYKKQNYSNKSLSPYEDFQILANFVQRYDWNIPTEREEKLHRKKEYYHKLATAGLRTDLNFEDMLLNEQMKWLEKSIADCQPISPVGKKNIDDCDGYQHYVVKYAIEEDILKEYKTGKYYDASLLEHHGIPHKEKGEPTSKEKEFCEKYRGGKIFNRSDLNKTIQIDDNISNGYEYMWQSFCDNTDQHQTYYVLVKRKKG